MATPTKKRKKAFVNTKYCVGCGVCVKNCPVKAISIPLGTFAQVDKNKCVGCTKCTKVCPASTIEMKEEVVTL